jgi:glycosyltransferase involved in cell wall biosynthesis
VQPQPGEGAETYLDVLTALEEWKQARVPLTDTRHPALAALQVARRVPHIARLARAADLVQFHGEVASLLCLPVVRARPSIVTTHGLHLLRRTTGARRRAAAAALRAIVSAADRTICVSESEREEAVAVLPPALRDKLVVIHNGLVPPPLPRPEDRRRAREALGLDDGAVVAVSVGQLDERKDPLLAVRAAAAARDRGAPIELLLAGDGPLLAAARADAGPGVHVLGRREDVGTLLAAADLFLLTSRREGLAYAVLEAMASGLPVVAGDIPGNAEALGEAGVLLPAGDRDRFAAALERLAADPDERERLGRLARERVERRFAAEEMLRRTREVYEEVAGR